MARNKDGEYDPNESGVRWWQETLHLNKDVSSSEPDARNNVFHYEELKEKENQEKKPFVSIKDVAKEYEKEVSRLEPFVPITEVWNSEGEKTYSSKSHFSLQNPAVTRKDNKYYVDGKELTHDEVRKLADNIVSQGRPFITATQKPKEDFRSGIYKPDHGLTETENRERYKEFVKQTEYNRNNPDRRNEIKDYDEPYKPYSWQVSQHKYPKGIKLNVDTEQQEIPLWKLDQNPHLRDSREKYNNIIEEKYKRYTEDEWNEVMKKRGFNPPLNPILPIEKGDDGEIKVLSDQEWKEKKKRYEDFQRDSELEGRWFGSGKLYEEGRSWENARAYAPPTLTEEEWTLNKKKYADYRDKLESSQKTKKWNIPDTTWWKDESSPLPGEPDEWIKEANFHKDYFDRRNREIEENKKYLVEDLKKTKEALRRVINEKNEVQKEVIHYLKLSDKAMKENSILIDKLKLLETNPEEYHRRKSLDPYGEENWEN